MKIPTGFPGGCRLFQFPALRITPSLLSFPKIFPPSPKSDPFSPVFSLEGQRDVRGGAWRGGPVMMVSGFSLPGMGGVSSSSGFRRTPGEGIGMRLRTQIARALARGADRLLTRRELEVAALVAEGQLTLREVASGLGLTIGAVAGAWQRTKRKVLRHG